MTNPPPRIVRPTQCRVALFFDGAFLFYGAPVSTKRWRPNIALADYWIGRLREQLSLPPPEVAAWASIEPNHRLYLLIASGLDAHLQDEPWTSFTQAEQARICRQIKVGADVARRWALLARKQVVRG